jgi:hypothetical protein
MLGAFAFCICLYVVISTSEISVQVSRDKLQFKLDQLRAGKTFQELDDDDITAVCAHSLEVDVSTCSFSTLVAFHNVENW